MPHSEIKREELSKYFHLPIASVASELGVCATMLKKLCRKYGIKRWPHRKIQSLNNLIAELEASIAKPELPDDMKHIRLEELSVVQAKKKLIMDDPNADVNIAHRGLLGTHVGSRSAPAADSESGSDVFIEKSVAKPPRKKRLPKVAPMVLPVGSADAMPGPAGSGDVVGCAEGPVDFHSFANRNACAVSKPLTELLHSPQQPQSQPMRLVFSQFFAGDAGDACGGSDTEAESSADPSVVPGGADVAFEVYGEQGAQQDGDDDGVSPVPDPVDDAQVEQQQEQGVVDLGGDMVAHMQMGVAGLEAALMQQGMHQTDGPN